MCTSDSTKYYNSHRHIITNFLSTQFMSKMCILYIKLAHPSFKVTSIFVLIFSYMCVSFTVNRNGANTTNAHHQTDVAPSRNIWMVLHPKFARVRVRCLSELYVNSLCRFISLCRYTSRGNNTCSSSRGSESVTNRQALYHLDHHTH